jgi:hypothetical protein
VTFSTVVTAEEAVLVEMLAVVGVKDHVHKYFISRMSG